MPRPKKEIGSAFEEENLLEQEDNLLEQEEGVEVKETFYESNKIILRTLDPKKQYDIIRPVTDRFGRLITGQEPLPYDEAKKKYVKVVDEFTEKVLTNPTVIDLTNPIDKIDWGWMEPHPYIVKSEEEARRSPKPVWYIYDAKKSADLAVRKKKEILQLQNQVIGMSLEDKRVLMRAVGEANSDLSESQVEEFLLSRIESEKDTNFNIRVSDLLKSRDEITKRSFVFKLLDKGIVEEDSNFKIYHNNRLIAESFDDLLKFVSNRANQEQVALWKAKV